VKAQYERLGWVRFPFDTRLAKWVQVAKPVAVQIADDPEWQANWLRCGGTWFVGVNCLPNAADGGLGGVSLGGQCVDFIHAHIEPAPIVWDQAQVSVCYQGYPKPWSGESDAALRYRRDRDAAHVDGLHREGPDARRYMREFHQFVLGIPLSDNPADAAPFVIWEGSHKIVQAAFQRVLAQHDPKDWAEVDLTDVYHATRRAIFETSARVEIPAKLGEAYVIHRHALHGVASWADDLEGPPEGRMIAYFRPVDGADRREWLFAD
jgi:hypothetical protein